MSDDTPYLSVNTELQAAIDAEREAVVKPDPWHPKAKDIRISPRTIWAMTARAAYVTMPAKRS